MRAWIAGLIIVAGCASIAEPEDSDPGTAAPEPTCQPVCEDDLCTVRVDQPEPGEDWQVFRATGDIHARIEAHLVGCAAEAGCTVELPVPSGGRVRLATLAEQSWDLDLLVSTDAVDPRPIRFRVASDWSADQGPPPTADLGQVEIPGVGYRAINPERVRVRAAGIDEVRPLLYLTQQLWLPRGEATLEVLHTEVERTVTVADDTVVVDLEPEYTPLELVLDVEGPRAPALLLARRPGEPDSVRSMWVQSGVELPAGPWELSFDPAFEEGVAEVEVAPSDAPIPVELAVTTHEVEVALTDDLSEERRFFHLLAGPEPSAAVASQSEPGAPLRAVVAEGTYIARIRGADVGEYRETLVVDGTRSTFELDPPRHAALPVRATIDMPNVQVLPSTQGSLEVQHPSGLSSQQGVTWGTSHDATFFEGDNQVFAGFRPVGTTYAFLADLGRRTLDAPEDQTFRLDVRALDVGVVNAFDVAVPVSGELASGDSRLSMSKTGGGYPAATPVGAWSGAFFADDLRSGVVTLAYLDCVWIGAPEDAP